MSLDPYRDLVRKAYAECIRSDKTIDSSLRLALKSNERLPAFIDNLAQEFVKLADMRIRKGRPLPSDKHLRQIVFDMTAFFIVGLKKKGDLRNESQVARAVRESKENAAADLDASAGGDLKGDFAELVREGGITTVDSRSATYDQKKGSGRTE